MNMHTPVTSTVVEWKSPSLDLAYQAVRDVMHAMNPRPATDLYIHMQLALDAIEAADCELEKRQ